ncbi:acyl-CoA dehydrogenase [Actinomadura sp. NBRC 104412]|uniref:acyl-CoA dehydrogenase family protein n=1 Tax=Actinomadura sp. NBRC 104412 TaxID=3032203 RepID=UPI0024A54E5B|nr:acyl-CoA dehydrogenase family protein [Actinomadura sp. NBRC 104412]GLZ06175.1 acyl-CoA dehydrogenase [Actinomadura sp. NBRC 104412]
MNGADQQEIEALREVAARFLTVEASSERVRAVVEAGGEPDPRLVREAAELGWFGLEVPEPYGGAGAGFAAVMTLLEETGARAASLPLVSSAVLCVGALLLTDSPGPRERWLPGLAAGTLRGTALLPGAFGAGDGDAITAREVGGMVLDGACGHVLDARCGDLFVVAARTAAGERIVAVVARTDAGVSVEPLEMVDGTRCVDAVRLTRVRVDETNVLARGAAAERLVAALVNRAATAVAADSLGIARRVLDMTVDYAGRRVQFGRPIGSFQAVKHQAADMLVDVHTARELVRDAACRVDRGPASPATSEAASMAKSHVCEVAARSAGTAVQLHGGIGYTWEHDLHLFLKRAKLNEHLCGGAKWHRARVSANLFSAEP